MTDACTHWWMLPTPDGPTLLGRCKRCGAEREYPAAAPVSLWHMRASIEADTALANTVYVSRDKKGLG